LLRKKIFDVNLQKDIICIFMVMATTLSGAKTIN